MEGLTPENEDQKKGIAIVKYALTRPLYTIADNAGLDASVIVNQVANSGNVNEGFDAANEKMVDMISAGIIDPAKVVRTALTDASGVASLLCTAEVIRKCMFFSLFTSDILFSASLRRSPRRSQQCPPEEWEAWEVGII